MTIINTDTNCSVGAVKIPVGQVEVPWHGNLGIITSDGSAFSTNVGTADTLFVWTGGCSVGAGYDVWLSMSLGIGAAVAVFGVAGAARFIYRQLRGSFSSNM